MWEVGGNVGETFRILFFKEIYEARMASAMDHTQLSEEERSRLRAEWWSE